MLVFARVPFEYAGKSLDRFEITELKGTLRDEKLLGLKYFIEYRPSQHSSVACDNCGRRFANETGLMGHKRKPSCISTTQEITKQETAEFLGVDVNRVVVE